MTSNRETTVDQAYAMLRAELTSFGLKPGARLNETALAADLGMSRAPVREALNRLIPDGLVRFEPGRGFFCRKLSVREITELYQVRFDLEAGALGAALRHASQEDLEAFAASWQISGVKGDMLVVADEDFHIALARLGANEARIGFLRNINDRIRFVRRINLESDARRESALAEHARLIAAMLDRDEAKAMSVLSQHLERSAAEVQGQVRAALAQIYEGDIA